ncbi:hypothetical protein KIW84_075710 [Lathyrus oleraceus]|uniref:Uncharacterized protein n=1 Tax=Pisum sativum TaxID=3888 RepID=A0A9D4VW07_PEA|nr:hypothetical protein KIW84_075710 [Pisum sativum]
MSPFYTQELQPEIHRMLATTQRDIKTMSLGQIHQIPVGYEEIKSNLLKLCADNHEEFRPPKPLWKNKDFFVQLPFKLNEDVNPTKATHPGMSPSDYTLAREECNQLLKQGLIEPTKSKWACQAFYMEKRSEKLSGKKRLVIDYKPLNHFLKDNKFPIPKAPSILSLILSPDFCNWYQPQGSLQNNILHS